VEIPICVSPRTNGRIGVLPVGIVTPADSAGELIVAQIGDQRAAWYFSPDRELNYPAPQPQATLDRVGEDRWRLSIATRTLLRDIVIQIDRIDPAATISDNLVTILPGESSIFEITTNQDLKLHQLTAPPVFQCANRFGKRRRSE
jgi:beta-mannosidase